MNAKFTFKPLTISDLDLLCRWFEKPHVLEWWSDRFTPTISIFVARQIFCRETLRNPTIYPWSTIADTTNPVDSTFSP